jgi:Bacterial sugar transferase
VGRYPEARYSRRAASEFPFLQSGSAFLVPRRSQEKADTTHNFVAQMINGSYHNGGGYQQRRDKAGAFHLGVARIHRLTALKGNGVMMRLDDGPAAARGGTKLMLGSERIRRMLDFAGAATGLILFAPMFLVTAIAIKLDSGGPIFVRESMFGHRNRKILLFNFRFAIARGAGNTAARLTPIGQILSETGIDELPQLFNVLLGDLSIVGPSPSPYPNQLLNKIKPGMIQWSQIVASLR